jgi:hypothetical protein
MPTFSQIYSQFNNAKAQNLIGPDESLADYAKKALSVTGDPSYQSVAEGGTVGNFVRSRSADLTNFVNSGPVDEWLGQGTQWIGDKFGINPETSRSVGESLPRMAVDFLPMAVGAAMTSGASLVPSVVGMAATSGLSAANAYEQSGQVSDALIGGAAPYVGGKLSEIGGRAALNLVPKSQILQRMGFTGGTKVAGQALTAAEQAALMTEQGLSQFVAKGATKSFTKLDKPLDKALHYLGGEALANVGFTGLDVLQQGTDAVFNRDYLFANLVSNVPFAAADMAGSFRSRQLGESQINLPEAAPIYRTPGEEKAVYAAALFKDLESPEAVESARKRYGLDIVDMSIKTEGLKAALNAKESVLRTAELDFVTKWNDYVSKTPLAQDAGFTPIQRGGAFGRDFVGLDKVIGNSELPMEAKALVDEFKQQRSSLRASYSKTVDKLADPISIKESLPKAIEDLNLDEFLKTPIEQRDYAKALEKTFLSLDGVDLIRDIHRREAGLEPLRPELYQEYVDLYSGKPASFTPDKRIELTVAASLARGAVPKFEKAKRKVEEAQEEGKTQEETVQEVVQAFEEDNKVAGQFKQPVIFDVADTQSGLVVPGETEGGVEPLLGQKPVVAEQPAEVSVVKEPTLMDRINEEIATVGKGNPAFIKAWTPEKLSAVEKFIQTRDESLLDVLSKPQKNRVYDVLKRFDPVQQKESDLLDQKAQARTKILNTLPKHEVTADELELRVLDDNRIEQERVPLEGDLFPDTQWARVVDQNKKEHLIPLPEGELQRVEAFAKGILAKLVPAEELSARSEELINLAKMFNNPEVAYAELGKLVRGQSDAQFADGYYLRPAVQLNGVIKEGRLHVDAWQQHLKKPFSQWNNEPAFKNSKEKEGFMTPDGFLTREQAKIEFEKRGGKLKMSPGEAPRDWLDTSDVSDFFAQGTGKVYGAASYDKMQILINSKAFQSKSPAEQLKFIWSHENSHIAFRKALEGAYGAKAKTLADASLSWVNSADPQARKNVEDVVRELHLDPELAQLDGIRDVLNNPDPQEWLANVWAMYALGTLKPNNSKAAFSMLPRPIRDFFDWAVSGIQNLAKGAQMWARLSGKDYKAAKDMKELMNTVRRSFRQAEWNAAQAEKFLDIEPSSMIERGNEFAFAQSQENDLDRMGQVGEQKVTDWRTFKRQMGNVWNKAIQPIHTLANAHKEFVEPVLAVMNAPLDTDNAIGDVFKVVVGELDGRDKVQITNKAFERVQKSESLLKLANAIMIRAEVKNQRMIKLKDNGDMVEVVNFDALSPEQRGQFQQFSPEAQQALASYIAQAERANIMTQKKNLESTWSEITSNLALLLTSKSSFNKADFKKAPAIAEGMLKDLQLGDTEGAVSKLVGLDEFDRAKLMEQTQQLYAEYAKLEKFYNERPTYMSFKRFGDIRQRISKPGEDDDVVDADSELELQEKLKPYLADGWTQTNARITKKERKNQEYRVNSDLLKLMNDREKLFKSMIQDSGTISQEDKNMILNYPSSSDAMISEINSRELYKPTTGRKLTGDLARYDWYEQFVNYTPAAISSAQRRALSAKVNFWMQDPALLNKKLQKDQFMALYEQSRNPDPEWVRKVNKLNAVWHIGWNLPGHIAELFQPMVAMLPELQAKGESLPGALKLIQKAERDVVKMHGYRLKDKLFKPDKAEITVNGETFEGLAAMWLKANGTSKETVDEARMLHEKRGRIQKAPLSEIRDFTGQNQIRLEDSMVGRTMSKLKDAVTRPFHTYADAAMGFYSNFTQHNGVVTLITSYRKFRKQGLSHEEAMQKAELFDLTVNNSGGRLERSELYGKLGSTGPLVLGLSSYTRGRFSQLATFYRHGFNSKQFEGKLSNAEIANAKKAFQTMILAQVGAAGLLGLPFVGAGIALMEELLGEDIKGKMLTALDEVTNDPTLSRTFSHGMMSAMAESFGVPADLHSRFALSSFLGTNSYDGISAKSFMGPSVAMLDSMFNLGSELAKGESLEKALTVAGPGGVKRLAEAISEDFQRDNPEANLASSMLGFRSSQMVKRKEWDQITRKQELEGRRDLEKSAMEISKKMEINPRLARQQLLIEADKLVPQGLDRQGIVNQRQQNIKDLIQKVSLLQADKVGPQDPRRQVSGRVAPLASQTAQAMGVQMQNPMELARAMAQQKTRSQLGATSSQRPVRNAMLQEMQWSRNPWEF